ncbi:hypothetical protein HDU96_009771 [Phlyctochytrium bullatum]|nr:hypothetical protein HDU96_009771 [Phlyctochytrium bullatum]
MGTAYSSMTQALAPVFDAYGIPVCDGAATSPALSNKNSFPNFFRTVPQDNNQAFAIVDFLAYQQWSDVAIVASQSAYGQNLANELAIQLSLKNITVILRENFFEDALDHTQTVGNLKESLTRVIIYCGYKDAFLSMVQIAKRVGIFGPGYAWVTSDGVKLAQSLPAEKLQPMNGIINVFPTEGRGPLYNSLLREWSNADITKYSMRGVVQPYSLFYVNCLETLTFGFDRIIKTRPEVIPIGNGSWNFGKFNIPGDFSFPERDTITGPIAFQNNGDRMGAYSLSTYDARTNTWPEFGTYEGVRGINITGQIVYSDGSLEKPPGSLRDAASRTVITLPNQAAILIIIFTTLCAAGCLCAIAFLVMNRDRKKIKAGSVEFSILAAVGLLILSFSPLSLTGEPADWKCVAEIWVLPLSITLTIATLLCKSFRVFKVFNNKFLGLSISNLQVMSWISAFLLCDARRAKSYLDSHQSWFDLGAFVQLLVVRCKDPDDFLNQSNALLSVVYTFSACCVFPIALISSVKLDKAAQVLVKAFATYGCVCLALYYLYGSAIMEHFKDQVFGGAGRRKSSAVATEQGMVQTVKETESNEGSESGVTNEVKLFRKNYSNAEECFLREKTSVGIVVWTPHIIATPREESHVYLFASATSTSIRLLSAGDWLPKAAERDSAVPKKEPFHAVKLTKTQKSKMVENDFVLRFKEAGQATDWLNILSGRMKAGSAHNAGGGRSSLATRNY